MSDTPFHQTRMGHTFYEATVPALVRELARLNTNLERLLAVVEGEAKADGSLAADGDDSEVRR
jgi:hypothetical protein